MKFVPAFALKFTSIIQSISETFTLLYLANVYFAVTVYPSKVSLSHTLFFVCECDPPLLHKTLAFPSQTLLALLTMAMAALLRVVLSRPTTPTHFLKSRFLNPNHCSRTITMTMTTSSSSLEIWPGVQSENPFQVSGRTDAQFYMVDHHMQERDRYDGGMYWGCEEQAWSHAWV